MKVKIKKLNENAVVPYKTYDSDFCYDVVATSEEEIGPNVWKYGIGLAFEIERDKTVIAETDFMGFGVPCKNQHLVDMSNFAGNISLDFRPRSSVWKTGMCLSNAQGTVDELFRGEVSAVFYHLLTNMPRYKVGDRIGQIKLGFTLPIEFEIVDELNETERGSGSYGSTGK